MEEHLDRTHVGVAFQRMRRERVPLRTRFAPAEAENLEIERIDEGIDQANKFAFVL